MIWRLAILLLPWQTRWFSDASLAGWPWEQGRLSFYASWIPMLVAIVFVFRHSCDPPAGGRNPAQNPFGWFHEKRVRIFLGCLGTLLILSAVNILRDHDALRPILQWWVQISILSFLILSLWKANVSKRSIATWFVISLIPQALLGVWQFASQQVIGSKWLGIASQLPQTLGVSVIAHDGLRILRAYGGFPHPNIFGAWLAVGVIVALWFAATSYERRARWGWMLATSLFASVLVLTFSRAAWLAAAIGFVVLVVGAGFKPAPTKARTIIFLFPIIILSFVVLSQRQHIFARFDLTQRLEQKSVDQRVGSLREGLDLFLKHPLIGSGPNAELLLFVQTRNAERGASAPLEPPHNAFLLALDDVGIVGIIAIAVLFLVGAYGCTPSDRKAHIHAPLRSLFIILFILALFDHYLWSTWSGQALVAIVIFLIVEPKINP